MRFQEADFLRADFGGTLMVSSCYMCHVGGHDALKTDGEGNGNPLQNSCLENPKDRGAWWAAVYGVAQSRTRLKRLRAAAAGHITSERPRIRGVCTSTFMSSCSVLPSCAIWASNMSLPNNPEMHQTDGPSGCFMAPTSRRQSYKERSKT